MVTIEVRVASLDLSYKYMDAGHMVGLERKNNIGDFYKHISSCNLLM
jgi:hypothetical protein